MKALSSIRSKLPDQILVMLTGRPNQTINQLAEQLQVDYKTAQRHVKNLVCLGKLSSMPDPSNPHQRFYSVR